MFQKYVGDNEIKKMDEITGNIKNQVYQNEFHSI